MTELSLGLTADVPARPAESRRQFFDVSPMKLFVMSFVTFNLYQIYWFYKNWKIRKDLGDDVLPIVRAIFGVLFAYFLFKDVREEGRAAGVPVGIRPGAMAILFFFLQLTWRLPDPYWLFGFVTTLPLMAMQRDVAAIHRALGLDPSVNDGVTWKNVIGILIGGLLLLLIAIGMFLPPV